MDLNNLFRLLNSNNDSKLKIIKSHPLLKKYFSDNLLKRKPKKLDSPLAKKLEEPKHRLTEKYYSLRDIYKILEIEEFDKIRKLNYITDYKEAYKIKDPENKNYQLAQLYSQIKQDIKYFIGEEEQSATEDLPVEYQIQQNIILGSKEFEK